MGGRPQVVTGMRQALAIGIILMVTSETFAASRGLGFTAIRFQRGIAVPGMWPAPEGATATPGG